MTNECFDANPWGITTYVARRYPRMLIGRRWLHVVVADPALLDTLPQTTADWDSCLGIPAQLTAASAAGFTDAQLAAAAAQWALANRDEAARTALVRMPRPAERYASRPVVELQHLACAEAAVALLKAHGAVSAEARRADAVHTEALPTVVHRAAPDAWCAVSGDPHPLWLDGLLGLAPGAGRAWAGAPPLQAAVVHGGPWLQPSVFRRLGTGPWRGLAGPAAAAVRADVYRFADVDEDGPAGEVLLRAEHAFEGMLKSTASGHNGFAFDPYFYPKEFGYARSCADLTLAEKNAVSHRGKALVDVKEKFAELLVHA